MDIWIDREGGRHYHKRNCIMTKDSRFNYQPVAKMIDVSGDIMVGNKRYMPCPGCFSEERAKQINHSQAGAGNKE